MTNSQNPKIRHETGTAVAGFSTGPVVCDWTTVARRWPVRRPIYSTDYSRCSMLLCGWSTWRENMTMWPHCYGSSIGYQCDNGLITSSQSSSSTACTVRRHHTSPRDISAWQKLMHEGICDRRRQTCLWYTTHASLIHRRSCLPSGRFAGLELLLTVVSLLSLPV